MSDRIVIFGAGQFGRQAIDKYRNQIAFFVDNNSELWGKKIDGFEIKPIDCLNSEESYKVVIASRQFEQMAKQLDEMGISNYKYFVDDERAYYSTTSLVFNPYIDNEYRDIDETEYNKIEKTLTIKSINEKIEKLYKKNDLFDHIEIETVNRCNGSCEFCPVSKLNDTRTYQIMPWDLFEKIILELKEIEYKGKIALFSNNEPLLDSDIVVKHKFARKHLPDARFHLFTNGTLLTLDIFLELMKYLDELVIDNYNQNLELIRPCKTIVEYCENHPELKEKVTIVLRKPKEILTTRGGDAPNRKEKISYKKEKCILPFKQMIIRPDGKVSLCCNDPLGKYTLGDVNEQNIVDVWYNEKFEYVRECLYKGRGHLGQCEFCDSFSLQ